MTEVNQREDVTATHRAADFLPWPTSIRNLQPKLAAAEKVAALAQHDDTIGIGSGSTAYLALWALAARARDADLSIRVVPSSQETEIAAVTLDLPLGRLGQTAITWLVDGADEIDGQKRLLKGRGGALFKEKLLWASASRRIVVADPSKLVTRLGTNFPVPIEVHPSAVGILMDFLRLRGCRNPQLRTSSGKDGPLITESGFFILDARLDDIPVGLHADLKNLSGVLETGIFEGYEFETIA